MPGTGKERACIELRALQEVFNKRIEATEFGLTRVEEGLLRTIKEVQLMLTQTQENFERALQAQTSSINDLTTSIREGQHDLIGALAGKKQIPLEVGTKVVWVLGIVIIALLLVLVFTLTGQKIGWINLPV